MSSFLNPGGFKYDGGGYGNLPGYENPLPKDTPSWGGDYDWKGGSKGIDWGSGFDIDKSGMFEKLFDKAKDTEKYRRMGESSGFSGGSQQGAFGGGMASGGSGKVLENLGVVFPQQHSPMFIPGAEGKKGLGGTIGSLVGGIGGALIGGPAGFGIGSQLGGGVGSLF